MSHAPAWFAPLCAVISAVNAIICIVCYAAIRRLNGGRRPGVPLGPNLGPCGKWPS